MVQKPLSSCCYPPPTSTIFQKNEKEKGYHPFMRNHVRKYYGRWRGSQETYDTQLLRNKAESD